MYDLGDGPIKSIEHKHFWKTAILFALLIGGVWAWHYYKIRHDAQAEVIANEQFQAQQKNPTKIQKTIPRPKGSTLPR